MPQLGESIAEGTVVKWLIPTGGRVEKDQSLLEVETDKVALEIPSPAAGYLTEVFVQEGETVPVGTLIARLEEVKPDGVVNKVAGVILRHMEPPEGGRDYYSPAVRDQCRHQSDQRCADPELVLGRGRHRRQEGHPHGSRRGAGGRVAGPGGTTRGSQGPHATGQGSHRPGRARADQEAEP